jgi:predicted DNA-binding protein (MmcQ/YjbR family)
MNKRHWNTVTLAGRVPTKLIREMIDHSYALVVASLTKKVRVELGMEKESLSPKAKHNLMQALF